MFLWEGMMKTYTKKKKKPKIKFKNKEVIFKE